MNHTLRRCSTAAALCFSLAGSVSASPQLTLAEVLARLRAAPVQLAVEADLAAFEQQLAMTSGRLSEGPTVELGAGSRRVAGSSSGDLDVNLDLPLLARATRRTEWVEALDLASPNLRRFAVAQAQADASTAYLDAWHAQELQALRLRAMELHDRWLRVAEERAAAGALAGYEVSLLRAERATTMSLLTEARVERRRAWAVLAATLEGGNVILGDAAEPPTLAPVEPSPTAAGKTLWNSSSLALAAVRGRAALERAWAGLASSRDRSRWSLRPGWAKEGDESVARFGVSFRIPRGNESASSDRLAESKALHIDRQVELDAAQIDARRQAAAVLADTLLDQGLSEHLRSASDAIEARWTEGKAGLAEVLPLRRQLLAAAESDLARQATRARAEVEWNLLSLEIEP